MAADILSGMHRDLPFFGYGAPQHLRRVPIRQLHLSIALILFAFAAPIILHGTTDPFVGVWEDIPKKTRNNFGQKPFQKLTRTITPGAKGLYDVKLDGITAGGERVSVSTNDAGDIEVPVRSQSLFIRLIGASRVRTRRVNERSVVATYLKDGTAAGTMTSVVADDGNTLTMKAEGTATDGRRLAGVGVYERQ
jgi:hypothetical protein